jgi:hypothetical protein
MRVDRISAGVFRRLSPESLVTYHHDVMCVYPNQTAAYEDLGRAFLAWARGERPV